MQTADSLQSIRLSRSSKKVLRFYHASYVSLTAEHPKSDARWRETGSLSPTFTVERLATSGQAQLHVHIMTIIYGIYLFLRLGIFKVSHLAVQLALDISAKGGQSTMTCSQKEGGAKVGHFVDVL